MGLIALTALKLSLFMAGGLWLPGWLLGRALRLPANLSGVVCASAALLLNLLLVLDACGIAFTLAHLAGALGVVCVVLAWVGARRNAPAPAAPNLRATVPALTWFLLPAGLGLAAIVLRATLDPLSGFDTPFRWDFLARQMLREGSLNFYPAVTADDFLHYGWCDGIAPLVSSLYFLAYASLGHAAAWATIPVVLAQAALLFALVWQLASHRGGPAAGSVACALLAASSAFLWGVAMGQETGLTALCLLAMFLFIEKHRAAPHTRWLVWAGLAAGTGALAREYGLVYLVLGGGALAWIRTPRRGWVQFLLPAVVVAAPWYLRNWVRTGNPLYSHALGGLFPVNPIHADYTRIIGELRGGGSGQVTLPVLGFALVVLAGAPLLLGVVAGAARWRERAPWLAALLTIGALWWWSVGQTSGGLTYSLRVLTPALALGAVLGGDALAGFVATRGGRLLAVALTALALDAGVRSLYLPVEPHVAWWGEPPMAWREFDQAAARWRAHPNWAVIADAAGPRRIVVSDPVCHAMLVERGATTVPLFSPAVRFLFAPDANYAACIARLRAEGVRFILMTRKNDVNDRLTSTLPFFRALLAAKPTGIAPLYFVFDLYSPDFERGLPAAGPTAPPLLPAGKS